MMSKKTLPIIFLAVALVAIAAAAYFFAFARTSSAGPSYTTIPASSPTTVPAQQGSSSPPSAANAIGAASASEGFNSTPANLTALNGTQIAGVTQDVNDSVLSNGKVPSPP
jgi:hypothetical protein